MTKSFEQLLYLFGAASHGKDIVLDDEINVAEIRKYAIEQGIWTVVYEKLSRICDTSKYHNEVFSNVVKSIRQREYTLEIIRKIEEKGIECCLLKGSAVAILYSDPDCRISSDTDILINPKDEKEIVKILSQNGYSVEERNTNDHHLKAYHPVGGLLEVHVRLYGKITEQVIFDGLKYSNEPYKIISINDNDYKTLGINDGLLYLTAHYIKHLVNSGGGIRQMMDLLLYIESYKEEIDFDNYYKILNKLRYEKLIKIVMSIGAKYFGFNYDIVDEELMTEILEDTEKGGIFGYSSDDRMGFYNSYCKKRTSWSKARYTFFYIFNGESKILSVFFPSRSNMKKLGYNDKFLLVAWVRRWIGILTRKKPIAVDAKKSGISTRMELMRKLNMVE